MKSILSIRRYPIQPLSIALLLAFTCLTFNALSQETSISFAIEKLNEELDSIEKRYLPFFNNETMSLGIYKLTANAEDGQQPHDQDEIYYVLEGKARILVESKYYAVEPGEIIFVPAFAKHKFVDIEKDIRMLVFFSKKEVSRE